MDIWGYLGGYLKVFCGVGGLYLQDELQHIVGPGGGGGADHHHPPEDQCHQPCHQLCHTLLRGDGGVGTGGSPLTALCVSPRCLHILYVSQ